MKDFFRGWQRKFGCVTLIVACMLMGMWIRSRSNGDWIRVCCSTEFTFLLESRDDCLSLQTSFDPHDPPQTLDDPIWFGTYPIHPENMLILDPIELESRISPPFTVPYWSLTMPLALLSAGLLFWRPSTRASTDLFVERLNSRPHSLAP